MGNRILVTGATGFLGKYVMAEITVEDGVATVLKLYGALSSRKPNRGVWRPLSTELMCHFAHIDGRNVPSRVRPVISASRGLRSPLT